MQHQLTWHGHSNFQINSPGINIVIDPFFGGNPSCSLACAEIIPPDVVLVTHDHGDHVGDAVDICLRTKAQLGAVVGTAGKLMKMGVPKEQILNSIGFNLGGSLLYKGATFTMVPAYHSSDSGVAAGYIITLADGYTIYHAGDTSIFASMELWGQLYAIDLALLPIGGTFTMDPRQAALACKLLGCKNVVPMHWGTFPVLEKNTESFKRHIKNFNLGTEVLDLAPNHTLDLDSSADTCGCD